MKKKQRLGVWLSSSACLACVKPWVQSPALQNNKQKAGRTLLSQILIVVHMCIEAMLGISLYSYSYLKVKKYPSYYS
jgi:hypothetical protein